MQEILKIENMHLRIEGKDVLQGLNLSIREGEKVVLFGQNGAGKSSLLYAILGFPGYRISSGKIIFKGEEVTSLPVNERVKRGMGIAFQQPPSIRGIKLKEMLEICRKEAERAEIERCANIFNMQDFLERDVNLGFSGGEAKRAEIFQIFMQNPDFTMFDEPDSGVDLENIELIGKQINEFLSLHSGLIITHQGYILNFIEATRACVLFEGKIICSGKPKDVLEDIKQKGYAGCVRCRTQKHEGAS